jgi:hypothetical protein
MAGNTRKTTLSCVPLSPAPAQVRAQEEFAALRRRAGWVAREVGAFWNKAERVVNYKVRA